MSVMRFALVGTCLGLLLSADARTWRVEPGTTLDEVNRLMESPDVSTDKIAKVISYDQAMAAKVLRMVNSPVYGFPGRISTLQHALMLLGFNVIRGLIISTAVFDAMNHFDELAIVERTNPYRKDGR